MGHVSYVVVYLIIVKTLWTSYTPPLNISDLDLNWIIISIYFLTVPDLYFSVKCLLAKCFETVIDNNI